MNIKSEQVPKFDLIVPLHNTNIYTEAAFVCNSSLSNRQQYTVYPKVE